MKKRLSLLIVLICVPLFAEINFNFSVTPDFSVTLGNLGEHLYNNNKNLEHNMTSLLTWQESPVLTAGLTGSLSLANLFLNVSFHAALPMNSGSMYDYDWFVNKNICQSRSISDESLTEAYFTDADFGYEFKISNDCFISPLIGFSYKYIDFYAAPTVVYADPTRYDNNIICYDSPDAEEFNGSWITYWRESYLYWIGVNLKCRYNKDLFITCTLKISPYSNTISEDNHPKDSNFLNRIYYQDLAEGFFSALQFNLKGEYTLSKLLTLVTKADILTFGVITGSTYDSDEPGILGSYNTSSYIGASQNDITFSTGLRINLF